MEDIIKKLEKACEGRRVWEIILSPDVDDSHEVFKSYLMRQFPLALFISHVHEVIPDNSIEVNAHTHVLIKFDKAITRHQFHQKVIAPSEVDYKHLFIRSIPDGSYKHYLNMLPDSDGIHVVPLKYPHKDYSILERIAKKHHVDVPELLQMVIYDYLEVGEPNE